MAFAMGEEQPEPLDQGGAIDPSIAELFYRSRSEDTDTRLAAQEELLREYGGFVMWAAKKALNVLRKDNGMVLDDLVQEGRILLLDSAPNYKPELGYSFLAFTGRTIYLNLKQKTLNLTGVVKIPERVQAKIDHKEVIQSNRLNLGLPPLSDSELEEDLGLKKDPTFKKIGLQPVLRAQMMARYMGSLDSGVYPNPFHTSTITQRHDVSVQVITDLNEPLDEDLITFRLGLRQTVKEAMEKLTPRQKEVITLMFGLDGMGGRSTQEICDLLGITDTRVLVIARSAYRRLRNSELADWKDHNP